MFFLCNRSNLYKNVKQNTNPTRNYIDFDTFSLCIKFGFLNVLVANIILFMYVVLVHPVCHSNIVLYVPWTDHTDMSVAISALAVKPSISSRTFRHLEATMLKSITMATTNTRTIVKETNTITSRWEYTKWSIYWIFREENSKWR